MKIPNKFNGYSRDGVRLYNGPAAPLALAGTSAIGTGVGGAALAAGAGTALGTGIAAGTALAGGAGLLGKLGLSTIGTGLGGAGGVLGGTALTPAVASLAPAATAQVMGPSMLQSAGIEALKGKVIGGGVQQAAAQQASNLAIQQAAAQNMAGGLANPMSQMGAKFLTKSQAAGMPIANANNLNFLNSSVAGGNTMPLGTTTGTQVINGKVVQGSLPPFNAPVVSTPNVATNAVQTANPSGFSEAGFRGIQPSGLNYPSLSNPTASPLSTTQAANPADIVGRSIRPDQNFFQNLGNIGSFQDVKDYAELHPYATAGIAGLGAMGIANLMQQKKVPTPENNSMIRPYTYDRTQRPEAYATSPMMDSSERNYFNDQFIAGTPYKATEMAEGGIASVYAVGGPVEQMAAMNSVGMNTGYPMAGINTPMYSNPTMQRPEATNVIAPSVGAGVGTYSGEQRFAEGGETITYPRGSIMEKVMRDAIPPPQLPKYDYNPTTMQFTQTNAKGNNVSGGIATPAMGLMQAQAQAKPQRPATSINVPAYQTPEQQLGLGGFYDYMNQQLGGYGGYGGYAAGGGVSTLGDYSDGGRLLRGPGDGVSDSIPASIGNRQPARLADGEFVVPARIVSELGNGSTEAGARKLYAMMERIQKGRRKSVGKGKVAVNSKADKHLPA